MLHDGMLLEVIMTAMGGKRTLAEETKSYGLCGPSCSPLDFLDQGIQSGIDRVFVLTRNGVSISNRELPIPK
jgi:hypothetical protein